MTIQPITLKNTQQSKYPQSGTKKPSFLNRFETQIKNSADMNDCIAVPRTIFKGYLGIMFGTTLVTVASLLKPSKTKTAINALAVGLSAFGTWSFARPYVLKGAVPTVKPNVKQ